MILVNQELFEQETPIQGQLLFEVGKILLLCRPLMHQA